MSKSIHIQLTKNFNSKEFDSPDKEFSGLNISPILVQKLQAMRDIVNFPIIIISGVRTVKHNKKVNGVAGSTHISFESADILAPTETKMYYLVKAAYLVGFTRIGVNKNAIHLDVSTVKREFVMWTYYEKKNHKIIV